MDGGEAEVEVAVGDGDEAELEDGGEETGDRTCEGGGGAVDRQV